MIYDFPLIVEYKTNGVRKVSIFNIQNLANRSSLHAHVLGVPTWTTGIGIACTRGSTNWLESGPGARGGFRTPLPDRGFPSTSRLGMGRRPPAKRPSTASLNTSASLRTPSLPHPVKAPTYANANVPFPQRSKNTGTHFLLWRSLYPPTASRSTSYVLSIQNCMS